MEHSWIWIDHKCHMYGMLYSTLGTLIHSDKQFKFVIISRPILIIFIIEFIVNALLIVFLLYLAHKR